MIAGSLVYTVMRVGQWTDLTVHGSKLTPPKAEGCSVQPKGFLPVFDTYDEALAWAGDHVLVLPLEVSAPRKDQNG